MILFAESGGPVPNPGTALDRVGSSQFVLASLALLAGFLYALYRSGLIGRFVIPGVVPLHFEFFPASGGGLEFLATSSSQSPARYRRVEPFTPSSAQLQELLAADEIAGYEQGK